MKRSLYLSLLINLMFSVNVFASYQSEAEDYQSEYFTEESLIQEIEQSSFLTEDREEELNDLLASTTVERCCRVYRYYRGWRDLGVRCGARLRQALRFNTARTTTEARNCSYERVEKEE